MIEVGNDCGVRHCKIGTGVFSLVNQGRIAFRRKGDNGNMSRGRLGLNLGNGTIDVTGVGDIYEEEQRSFALGGSG